MVFKSTKVCVFFLLCKAIKLLQINSLIMKAINFSFLVHLPWKDLKHEKGSEIRLYQL